MAGPSGFTEEEQAPSLSFSTWARSIRWTQAQQEELIGLFKRSPAAQWLSCVLHLYHRPGIHVYVCQSLSKLLFRPGDRCVADCWVAARLQSGPPASPALVPPALSGLRLSGWRGGARAVSDIRAGPERDEKELPFPVKRGRCEARGYTHWNAISCSSLLLSGC